MSDSKKLDELDAFGLLKKPLTPTEYTLVETEPGPYVGDTNTFRNLFRGVPRIVEEAVEDSGWRAGKLKAPPQTEPDFFCVEDSLFGHSGSLYDKAIAPTEIKEDADALRRNLETAGFSSVEIESFLKDRKSTR